MKMDRFYKDIVLYKGELAQTLIPISMIKVIYGWETVLY